MKKIAYILIFAMLAMPIFVLANGDHGLSVEDSLKKIREIQNVEQNKEIDCNKVTDEQLEELGEAVMSIMQPNEKQHQLMDQMMGGEGSESLKSMHIIMGQNYLGCFNEDFNGLGFMGRMGMMGGIMGSMMGTSILENSLLDNNFMMGNLGFSNFWGMGSITMILLWILIVLAIIALLKLIFKQNKN